MIIDASLHPVEPRDTAIVRRQLAAYFSPAGYGAEDYRRFILLGRQPLRPPGSPVHAAAELARYEYDRLTNGEVFFVDREMCGLLDASFATMPAFVPRPFDLPGERGFCLFAEPIGEARDEYEDAVKTLKELGLDKASPGTQELIDAYGADTRPPIHAVSWGPSPVELPWWTHGGVWFTFYASPQLHRFEHLNPESVRAVTAGQPPLSVDNEMAMAWAGPDTPADDERFALSPADTAEGGTPAWARAVFATFITLRQTSLTQVERVWPDRAERRRGERAGLTPAEIQVIRMRGGGQRLPADDGAAPAGSGRRYDRWRWAVRPHWRNQWYPKEGVHRPRLIAQYMKGPDDAPVKPGTKVHVVSPPPQQKPD